MPSTLPSSRTTLMTRSERKRRRSPKKKSWLKQAKLKKRKIKRMNSWTNLILMIWSNSSIP